MVGAAAIALLAIGSTTAARSAGRSAGAPYGSRIRLARAVFDPLGDVPHAPAPLSVAPAKAQLWLVQLDVPVQRAAQAAIPRTGLRLLGVVPDATYLARGDAAAAAQARKVRGVRAVLPFEPWFKVSPKLDKLRARTPVAVGTFADNRAADVAARLRAAGVAVAEQGSDRVLIARADKTDLASLARDDGVAAITPLPQMRTLNAEARWVTQSARRNYTPMSDHGLDGTGEVAAVADTGMAYFPDRNGTANWYFSDCTDPVHPSASTCKAADFGYQAPDAAAGGGPAGGSATCNGSGDVTDGAYTHVPTGHRKVVAYFNNVAQCDAYPGDSGSSTHGSHVSGSVAGNRPPYASADPYDGQAPQAKLVFQDVGDDGEGLAGLPGDYYQLLDQAYNPGLKPTTTRGSSQPAATPAGVPYARGLTPRVHSDSFGSLVPVVSLGQSPRADDFVTNNEDMAVVIAAGNAGPDQATVAEPGTAKDVITSGAMANGDGDFASIDAMANFSSHGEALNLGLPTPVPARIKPDVATPGLRVVSAKGGTNTEAQVLQGTSMSTPVLSGDALLVRQYFEDGFGPGGNQGDVTGFAAGTRHSSAGFNPSAALVKAVLVNSGQRMRGPYTGTRGGEAAQNGQWPSDGQGWGRVELDRALHLRDVADSPGLWVRDREFCPPPARCTGAEGQGVATGDDHTYAVTVAPGQPLKVVLAWSDPGGITSAVGLGAEYIVNQLSLQVDGPGGKSWCANHINTMTDPAADGATSVQDGGCTPVTFDKVNNVQTVYLPAPEAGTYTVHVTGQAVMQDQNAVGVSVPPLVGRQGYAVAATGNFPTAPASTAPAATPVTPRITSSSVSAPSSDLGVVRWTTDVPTTGEATITEPDGTEIDQADVYSRPADSFVGLDLTEVENDGQLLDKPMLTTDHVAKFTGLSPGTRYTTRVTATDAGGARTTTGAGPPLMTPAAVLSPTVAADTATLYSGDGELGPPIPDRRDTWGHSSQLYAGRLPSTASAACRISGATVCPPIDAGGAFKIQIPDGFKPGDITGAAVQLFTRHDLTSRVLGVPRPKLELLSDSAEKTWGSGTTYQQVFGAPTDLTVGPSTVYRNVPYDVETFTFTCAQITKLEDNMDDGTVSFRISVPGDVGKTKKGATLDEALLGFETGFGRRSSGLEYRPRLVLFGPSGDPLGQTATAAPAVSDVRTERVDGTTAVVHWKTDQPSDSVVLIHQDGSTAGLVQVGSPAFVTDHHVQVAGFDRPTAWQFALRSATPDGRVTTVDNGGRGWLLTDVDPTPPGPAPAAAGTAGFTVAGVGSDTLAPADGLTHGTGRACRQLSVATQGASPAPAAVRAARGTLPATGRSSGLVPFLALLLPFVLSRLIRFARRRPTV